MVPIELQVLRMRLPKGLRVSVTFLSHTTVIQEMSKRVGEQVTSLLHRKAFLHGYTGEDEKMDEEEGVICPCLFES